jgi:hypothetical protein
MRYKNFSLVIFFFFMMVSFSEACETDEDCAFDSTCVGEFCLLVIPVAPTGLPAKTQILLASNTSKDLTTTGAAGKRRILILDGPSGDKYRVGEFDFDWGAGGGNVDFSSMIKKYNSSTNTGIFHFDHSSVLSDKTLFLKYDNSHNKIIECGNATDYSEVFMGCAALSTITYEKNHMHGSLSLVDDSALTGKTYWKVENVSGTGLISSFFETGGGGILDFLRKSEYVDLDEDGTQDYISRQGIDYYLVYDGEKYLSYVFDVNYENEFTFLYIDMFNDTMKLFVGDELNLDFDLDGEKDALLSLEKISYPDVYFTLNLYIPEKILPTYPSAKEGWQELEEKSFVSGEGNWNRFFGQKDFGTSFLNILTFLAILALIYLILGGKLLSKIWKAT